MDASSDPKSACDATNDMVDEDTSTVDAELGFLPNEQPVTKQPVGLGYELEKLVQERESTRSSQPTTVQSETLQLVF